jgi:hypothetical protein
LVIKFYPVQKLNFLFIFTWKEKMSGNYARVLLLSEDDSLGTSFTQPTSADIIANLFDADNGSMVSLGLYTQDQCDAKKAAGYQHFLDTFGIDFLAGVNAGYGEYIAGDFILIPYFSGSKPGSLINVALDTDHEDRGANKQWHAFQFGQLVASTVDGTFSGGTHAGETYLAGDVLAYWDYQLIKTNGGPILPTQQREILVCYATLVGRFVVGCQGLGNFYSTATVIDQDGNSGFFVETIYFQKDPLSGNYSTQTRQIITFNDEAKPKDKSETKPVVKSSLAKLIKK